MDNSFITARDVDIFYGDQQALFGIDLDIGANEVTSLIGPSGCGKSTFLRAINRMNDLIPGVRTAGRIVLDGEDIVAAETDVVALRRKVGMVFQRWNPFPKSIFDNVAYGPRIHGVKDKGRLAALVEDALRTASLPGLPQNGNDHRTPAASPGHVARPADGADFSR